MTRKIQIICVSLAVLLSAAALGSVAPNEVKSCTQELEKLGINYEVFNDNFVSVNGVGVTGDFFYPLPVVLKNLGLDPNKVAKLYKGKKVLSVAEGFSGLLPYLLRKGLDIKGLDLWYHGHDIPTNWAGNEMRDYVRTYGSRLIQGDARKMPVDNESIDLILSNQLVSNFGLAKTRSFLRDAVRVLKKGGEARIYGFEDGNKEQISQFLNNNLGNAVSFSFEKIQTSWIVEFGGNLHSKNDEGYLLRLQKTRSLN